ncbi:MAG: inner membrane CreD family protein [Candidatus Cryptobacteroides sp.]
MLIPLQMIKNVTENREETKNEGTSEVADSYSKGQYIYPPYIFV